MEPPGREYFWYLLYDTEFLVTVNELLAIFPGNIAILKKVQRF